MVRSLGGVCTTLYRDMAARDCILSLSLLVCCNGDDGSLQDHVVYQKPEIQSLK